jgi:hypothetical protein
VNTCHVGAAAHSPELAETKSQYLGSEAQFNVYANDRDESVAISFLKSGFVQLTYPNPSRYLGITRQREAKIRGATGVTLNPSN